MSGRSSKTMFPSLRVGYLVVPPALVESFKTAVNIAGQYPPLFLQVALADFIGQATSPRISAACAASMPGASAISWRCAAPRLDALARQSRRSTPACRCSADSGSPCDDARGPCRGPRPGSISRASPCTTGTPTPSRRCLLGYAGVSREQARRRGPAADRIRGAGRVRQPGRRRSSEFGQATRATSSVRSSRSISSR